MKEMIQGFCDIWLNDNWPKDNWPNDNKAQNFKENAAVVWVYFGLLKVDQGVINGATTFSTMTFNEPNDNCPKDSWPNGNWPIDS